MNKKSYKIKHLRNADINIGDEVYLIDGSALTILNPDGSDPVDVTNNLYIVDSYPSLTGLNIPLKEIKAIVIKTNITDSIIPGFILAYVQDIIVQIGTAQFRTCSDLVRKPGIQNTIPRL